MTSGFVRTKSKNSEFLNRNIFLSILRKLVILTAMASNLAPLTNF